MPLHAACTRGSDVEEGKSKSYSVLHCVALCCSVLQCVAVCCTFLLLKRARQRAAVYCSVLQCVAVCCGVLQCVAHFYC